MFTFLKGPRDSFRFYIAIPNFLLIVAALIVAWRPIASWIFAGVSWITLELHLPAWASGFASSFLSDVLAALIVGSMVLFVLGRRERAALAGTFDAFDLQTGQPPQAWGKVSLASQLEPTGREGPRMRLRLENKDIILFGEGVVFQNQHFVGFYRETSRLDRRRCGAFFMTMQGGGDEYVGDYIFLDPVTQTPALAHASWKRVP